MQGQPEQKPSGQERFGSAVEAEDEAFDVRAEFGDVFRHGLFYVNIFSMLILIGAVIGTVTTVLKLLDQALKIRQSFVARVFRRYMAEIVNVGMGDEKEEQNSFLIFYTTEEKLKEQLELLLPEFSPTADQTVEHLPAAVWAAWAVPGGICAAVVCVSAAVCVLLMEEYTVLIWLGAAGMILILLIGMVLKYLTDGSGGDGTFLKLCHGYFGKNYISVRYSQIQYMEIKQNFIAKAFGIRKGEIHLLASSANAAHVIPYFRGNEDERIREGPLLRMNSIFHILH